MLDLVSLIKQEPERFNLFQAIYLLRRTLAAEGVDINAGVNALSFRTRVSLGFPSSEIVALISRDPPGEGYTLVTNVISLAGPQGPLPMVFTEYLLEEARSRNKAGFEFLDIFNERVLGLLYQGRTKRHLELNVGSPVRHPIFRALKALMGNLDGPDTSRPISPDEIPLIRHAGLQGVAPRSLSSFLVTLRDRTGIRFGGRPFIGSWLKLDSDDISSLGRTQGHRMKTRLGVNSTLGGRVWDQSSCVEIIADELGRADFERLLPGGRYYLLIGRLASQYFQFAIRIILSLQLKDGSEIENRLSGNSEIQLGINSWLGSRVESVAGGLGHGRVRTRFVCRRVFYQVEDSETDFLASV
jgi:type VI secretion system protein ImpH